MVIFNKWIFIIIFIEIYKNTLLKFGDKFVRINCDDLNYNYFNNLLIWGVHGYNEPLFYAYKGKTIPKESYDISNNDNIKEINNILPLNLMNNIAIDIKNYRCNG